MDDTRAPFRFVAASYLVLIRPERAWTLEELAQGLRTCSNASLLHHTFQSLERHHYTRFSSDFAQWTLAACHEARLAERLASVDVREFVSFDDLRRTFVSTVESHLEGSPGAARRSAFEPFFFCEHATIEVPLGTQAYTLRELAEGIRLLDLQTIHHHFINSRVRLQLRTNDFSQWIRHNLGLTGVAQRLDRIDLYVNSLEDLRREILSAIRSEAHA
jgi:hypothetical protein